MGKTVRKTKESLSKKKARAGKIGGLKTFETHGREHMAAIGAKGAVVFHSRYKLEPTHLNDFAIVRRETGEAVAFLSGLPFGR